MADKSFDSELVRALAGLLDETNLTEIEYETGEVRIRVARQGAPAAMPHYVAAPAQPAAASAPAIATAEDHAASPGAVPSPMVGVAYLAPEPGAADFVKVGDIVAEGQTLLLVEAMKTFNPIRAPKGGKIAKILVVDGHPVEFGEALMIIE